MNAYADLHIHTVYSDGIHTPDEIAVLCKRAGLGCFAVTDHDNIGGCEEGERAARREGLAFVRGWEISSYEGDSKIHMLGYACEPNADYEAFMKIRFDGAKIRAAEMIEKANALFGLDLTIEDAERLHLKKDAPIHTMHVVRAFAERLGADSSDLYRRAFAPGRPAFSEEYRPTPEQAIRIIHRMGGIAVLAHPGRIFALTADKYALLHSTRDEALKAQLKRECAENRIALMERFVGLGLDGLECRYTTHTPEETEQFLRFARERNLFVTGGSDFHAEGEGPRIGMPRFVPDERLLERIVS